MYHIIIISLILSEYNCYLLWSWALQAIEAGANREFPGKAFIEGYAPAQRRQNKEKGASCWLSEQRPAIV